MRLTPMNRRLFTFALSTALCLMLAGPIPSSRAQGSAPPNTGNTFKDTSLLKPPAGARVGIIEFEDLECPACAKAFPMVHAAAEHYKIPLERRDFPLQMHVWSFDAAVTARYLQDKVNPGIADEYRRSVFAAQTSIASKDDLRNFTQRFFQAHGAAMPFVVDPQGTLAKEVRADYALGERIGLSQTPTIWVVTPKSWVQVTDPTLLYQTIDAALAETPAARGPVKKTVAVRR